ncbi:NHLP bacteriocin system secretion protein [Desulfitibacter alkalitolerans]|uniref:NHLP bacteriocin system secretion protein n=1 Tax=Desulfitibacter alkalitolerans TaxID=264641 RepID=UPI000558AA09|nr:NHLP bacteriocin system secretion protein [Desulfitibacter alkalitolerans]
MIKEKGLFREVSLKKLSSPEQLDQLIKVTSPKAWFALIALSCILLSAIAWGFLGSIPVKIGGQGILLNDGGVLYIKHHTSGQVIDKRFKAGDTVKKGDVLARIEVPQLVSEINNLLQELAEMEGKENTQSAQYKLLESQILQLRSELVRKSQIVSQIDGRIIELHMNKGSIVQPGESLVTLERYGETVKMEAIIYVPAEQGGIILPGMEAQISPAIVNKEEYGFMLGRVISVSEYPATMQSMMQTLDNEHLISLLVGQGAPLEVRIDLIPDYNTESGYKWSSPEGPPMSIHSGTIVQGVVITGREKPIHKVMPFLKRVNL